MVHLNIFWGNGKQRGERDEDLKGDVCVSIFGQGIFLQIPQFFFPLPGYCFDCSKYAYPIFLSLAQFLTFSHGGAAVRGIVVGPAAAASSHISPLFFFFLSIISKMRQILLAR